jgi:hypothetical protein
MIRRLLLAPLLALVFTGAAPSGVSASCAGPISLPEQIQAAALVFVGTVQATSDGDRVAQVMVESIWKGPLIPQYVNVHGSPVSGLSASSVDRQYQAGTRYLFVLYSADQPLQDNSCTGTQPYTSALAPLKPSDARPPIMAGYPTDPVPNRYQTELVIGSVALIVLVITTTAFMATRALRSRKRS